MFVCLSVRVNEPTGADSGDVLVSLWMEVMRLSWQLCWCQGGSARLTANVQCVIHLNGVVGICMICAVAERFHDKERARTV